MKVETFLLGFSALAINSLTLAQVPPPPSVPTPGQMPSSISTTGVNPEYSESEIQENLNAVYTRQQEAADRRIKSEARIATGRQGCLSGDCRDGTGEHLNHDGSFYNGENKSLLPHGVGTFIWPDGAEYVGDFDRGMQHGQGRYASADGSLYTGEFVQNVPSGHGTDYYVSGDKYVGNHENGQANGQGTYYSADGWTYIGDHQNGVSHGNGTYYFPDGRKYIGEFADGAFNGRGVSYFANGKIHYSGNWRNNRPAK